MIVVGQVFGHLLVQGSRIGRRQERFERLGQAPTYRISTMVADLVECCSPTRNQVVSKGEAGLYKLWP
jgi:hypothetical protein